METLFGYNSANFWKMILIPALKSTIQMVVITAVIATIFGTALAIVLIVTDKNGVHPNKILHGILETVVNIVRSFPFVILMVFLLPFTRVLVGTSIGIRAALVPLIIAASAFIAKLIEGAMKEVDPELIEVMQSFGISNRHLILKVIVSEALPAMISGIILATIAILGTTAVAGTMGAGGIGSAAIVYGYQSFNYPVMCSLSLILVIFVEAIQGIGNLVYKKMK